MILDVKLGYECNNHCIHCVVEPMRLRDKESGIPEQKTYAQIIGLIRHELSANKYDGVVLTGGEPLLRRDFWRIVRRIQEISPGIGVSLQTNGRLLKSAIETAQSDPVLFSHVKNMSYVISLHGDREIHNDIVRSGSGGDPYAETMESLLYFKDVLVEDFNRQARIETVLSRKNSGHIVELLTRLDNAGITKAGISYPHLEGYPDEYIRDVIFPVSELPELAGKLSDFALSYPHMRIMLECFPPCLFNSGNGIAEIPENIHLAERKKHGDKVVYLDGSSYQYCDCEDANGYYEPCGYCALYKTCDGMWPEAVRLYGCPSFVQPITMRTVKY